MGHDVVMLDWLVVVLFIAILVFLFYCIALLIAFIALSL